MLLTLSNPLHLAVVGNPPRKGAAMARRRTKRISKRAYKSTKRVWRKKVHTGRFKGLKVHVKRRAGFRKAIKGIRGTGRKGTVSIFSKIGRFLGTNPRKRGRNPAILATAKDLVITPVTSLPQSVPALFKGPVVKNVAFAAGGAVVGLAGGSMLQKFTLPLLAKLPVVGGYVAQAMGNSTAQRVVGAGFALLAGSAAGFAVKDSGSRKAFVTGAAAAAIIEAIFPGRASALLARIPVVGQYISPIASPVQGIAGLFGTDNLAAIGAYVESPAYQGTNGMGAYVESPAYQGTNGMGAYVESPAYQGTNGMSAYVESPAYQGTNGLAGPNDAVAGMGYAGEQLADLGAMGSQMASHLDG
jgi:hypothetical protein